MRKQVRLSVKRRTTSQKLEALGFSGLWYWIFKVSC